jgi:hypothetical protein
MDPGLRYVYDLSTKLRFRHPSCTNDPSSLFRIKHRQDNIFMGFTISWGWDAFKSDGRRLRDFNLVILAPLQAHVRIEVPSNYDETELAHPCL